MSLKQKTIKGFIWNFAQQFSLQIITFLVSIVLARILSPADFGVMGILTLLIAIGTTLTETGLTSSLIRTQEPSEDDYSTIFIINIGVAFVFYLLLFALAPFIAQFLKTESLTSVIRIFSISLIIRSFVAVHTAVLTKAMDFKLQSTIQIPSLIAGGLTGIYMAYMGFGIWSLVWMNIVQSFFFAVQHWLRMDWRPALVFNKERFKFHFLFGYKITLSGLLETVFQNIYSIIIGRYFSTAQLGFYLRAYSLRQLPVQNIAEALNKVSYPFFSEIQNDDIKLKEGYKKLMTQMVFWLTPCLLVLFVLAEPLIRFLFTDKWLPSVPYFKILLIAGITYPLHSFNLNILKVKGRSDLFLKLEIVKKVFTAIGIALTISFGLYALLYFQLANSVISYFINAYYSGEMINYPIKEQIEDILPPLSLSLLLAFLFLIANSSIPYIKHLNDVQVILLESSSYLLVYLCLSQLTKSTAFTDFKTLILR
ncbi:MAG: flippase, partial [Daejeonella sp.]|nr:flippase [Daejeonella sp.]